jgi:hypothetical protein
MIYRIMYCQLEMINVQIPSLHLSSESYHTYHTQINLLFWVKIN